MPRRKIAGGVAQLKVAQNHVRGSTSPRAGLSKARPLVPASEMQAFIEWLPTVKRNGRGIVFDLFPRSLEELWRSGTLGPATLVRELAWASAMFRQHAKRLSAFRAAASAYEAALVDSSHDECRAQLGEIERQFGSSLWVIETRLALLQRSEGLESQKAYVSEVREARGQNDIIAFLTYHLSRRNEPDTTPLRYVQQLEDIVAGWPGADDLAAYVLHRLGNRPPATAARYSDVLRFEASAALVDHYETFVRLAAYAGSMGDDLVKASFKPETLRIALLIDDERLRRSAFLLSEDGAWLKNAKAVGRETEDALIVDDYTTAATFAETDLALHPSDGSAWVAAARAWPFDANGVPSTSGLRASSIDRVRRLVGRADDVDEAAIALLKDALNHRLQGFAPALDALVWSEMSTLPDSASHLEALAFVHEHGLRPSDVGRVGSDGAVRAVAARVADPSMPSIALTNYLLRANVAPHHWPGLPALPVTGLPDDVVLEAEVARAATLGDHEKVLELAERLSSTGDVLRRRRATRHIGHSLLELERVPELASLIARSCVVDPALAGMLPVAECANRLDRDLRRKRAGDLAIPIVLDLFSKRYEDALDDVRSYAYEDFLLAHGLERPSDLDQRIEDFEHDLLIHYLRHLCVPGVMQVSSAFQGTRELEDERKKVLSLLVKLDPMSAKDYEAELREVARAQLIHRGVRQVERSKIYVDVTAIRRAFEKKHRETFQRHQALSRAGIGTDDHELEVALQQALTGKPLPQQVLEVPKNEANDLLLQMLRWLFVECTGSPEHGLDCYLSMRIRHGTLSGQLRTPLEVERLITQRAADSDEYGSNAYWVDRLGHLQADAGADVDVRLATFSSDYDALIARIAGEMIQIQSSEKPDGLFNISLKSVRFRLWVAELTPDITFDAFFDTLMELFWESVEHSLDTVRRTIDEILKPEINAMFADLESGVEMLAGGLATTDLDRAIRTAQTGTLQALDIVKDWFRLSQPITEPDFPIGDLIDVGLQCVTAIHREFAPHVVREVDPLPPIAGALVLFSDIFFIIFDNVRRHSGVGARPSVTIEVRDQGDRLRIVARNEVSTAVRSVETIERIDAIRQAIAEGDYRRAVTSEGGTGLIKLRKLIGQGEGGTRRLEFGFDGNEFVVELELGKREIER